MTKADIVDQIADRTGLTKKDVADTVDKFLDAVGRALANGQHIEIRGFGTFKVRERKSRLARNPRTGVPVFYVTQLDDDDGGTAGGYLTVVSFGSRPTTGERLRSNLQQLGNDTEEASPPASDTWVRSIRFDGTPVFDGIALPVYKHPGSMALVDDVLFVPVDQPTSDSAPTGHILLFDVSADATDPVPLQALALTHKIDNLAVTRLADGTYRLWTNGDGGQDVNVYDTTHADLREDDLGLTLVQVWDPATDLSGTIVWPTGSGAHQGSAFLREADGDLYLIGIRHPGGSPFTGSDFADLYFVDEAGDQLVLDYRDTKQFNCVYDGGGGPVDMRVCNMAAANNAYVSPTGELILYSIPHDDEDGFDPDIVRQPFHQPAALAQRRRHGPLRRQRG
jgi:nucleoid DNA-binding protein